MRVNYLMCCWESAPQQRYLQFPMGKFKASLLFVMPACNSGQRKGFCRAVGTLTCVLGGEEEEEEQGSVSLKGGEMTQLH